MTENQEDLQNSITNILHMYNVPAHRLFSLQSQHSISYAYGQPVHFLGNDKIFLL